MNNRQIPSCPMCYQGPMENMYDPMIEEEDERDLAMLYPRLYHRVMPLVKYNGDQMERRYGVMYCPTIDELRNVANDIYDKIEKDMNVDKYDEDESDNENRGYYRNSEDEIRQRPHRRRFLGDLIRILLLRDLHRRRRRRRRMRPYSGGYGY